MSLVERIVSYVPGYRGYKQKELRRESDRLIRMKVSALIREGKENFESFSISNLETISKDKDLRMSYDNIRFMFDKVWQKIDKAEVGYSGFFDIIKIREEELDQITKYDLSLIDSAEKIKNETKELNNKILDANSIKGEMRKIISLLQDLEEKIDERNKFIHGIGEKNA
jgi:hypothetical protein